MDKNTRLFETEKTIIKVLDEEPYFTIPKLASIINKSERQTARIISSLKNKNIIERIGSRKTGYWRVIK